MAMERIKCNSSRTFRAHYLFTANVGHAHCYSGVKDFTGSFGIKWTKKKIIYERLRLSKSG